MSGTGKPKFAAVPAGKARTPIKSVSDKNFLESLSEFIEREKELLQCPDEGPDEQRYIIYSSAFDKVIEYATAYKTVLTAIKKEYDDSIGALKKSDSDAKLARAKLKARVVQPTSLMYCQRRAVQLRERIAIIQRDTAERQAELRRLQDPRRDRSPSPQHNTSNESTAPRPGQIPGLSLDESMDAAALDKHLEHLEWRRGDLLSKRKSRYVSVQVKADLDHKMRAILDQRDELEEDNERLQLRYKQLRFLNDAFNAWEKTERDVPLLEFLTSKLENVSSLKVSDTDYHGLSSVLFEDDDPSRVNEFELPLAYIERFNELFEAGEYEAAAFHAARSPHGVLRNMETMERFQAVREYQGETPPPLLFFQALMISVNAGKWLPGVTLSVEGVRCALEHDCVELVTHWVTQNRLTYSEALGDVICEHGDRKPLRVADVCLALAHVVYSACGVRSKAALSMCKRGMADGAAEFIRQNKDFAPDDCVFVLRGSPSLALLQALTQPSQAQPAVLSVGFACRALLLSDLEVLEDLVLQLLDYISSAGPRELETVVAEDASCPAESWGEIAGRCARRNRPQLSEEILSALLGLSEEEGAGLMEHVLM